MLSLKNSFALFTDAVDIGDIISVTGTFFTTKRGEQSILVTSWTMAAKALLPLPEKWHGLTDPDEKFRKRYLDFIMDPETRDLFYKKAKFWDVTARLHERPRLPRSRDADPRNHDRRRRSDSFQDASQ